MKHVSRISIPAPASLLEWQQIGGVVSVFATALGAVTGAFNVLTQALERKGEYDDPA